MSSEQSSVIILSIVVGIIVVISLYVIVTQVFGFKLFHTPSCREGFDLPGATKTKFFSTDAVTFDKVIDCPNKQFIIVSEYELYHLVLFSFTPGGARSWVSLSPEIVKSSTSLICNSKSAHLMFLNLLDGSLDTIEIDTVNLKSRVVPFDLSIQSLRNIHLNDNVIYCALVKPQTAFIDELDDMLSSITIYDYSKMYKPDIFRLAMAYTTLVGVDLRAWMPKRDRTMHIFKLLSVPTVVYTCSTSFGNDDQKLIIKVRDSLTKHDNSQDNFFEMLGFQRLKLSINESFTQQHNPIVLDAHSHMSTEFVVDKRGVYKALWLNSMHIDDVAIKPGDQVILHNQDNQYENDTYIVRSANHLENKVFLETKFRSKFNPDWRVIHQDFQKLLSFIKHRDPYWQPPSPFYKSLYFEDIDKTAVISGENVIMYDDREQHAHKFECLGPEFTQPQIVSKATCMKQNMIWDRRCVSDGECPFFGKYGTTYRGGCNDNGYCEMPTGVDRQGYRQYVINGTSYPRQHPSSDEIAFPLDFIK